METVLELPGTGLVFTDLFATQPESQASRAGTAEMVCVAGATETDFSACYAQGEQLD